MALHDPLTGLPNRTLVVDRAEQMLIRSRRSQLPTAALTLGIDHFKEFNDTHGYQTGDELLKAVAERLRTVLREADTIGRVRRRRVHRADRRGLAGGRPRARGRTDPRRPARAVLSRRRARPSPTACRYRSASRSGRVSTPSTCCTTPTPLSPRPRRRAGAATPCSARTCRRRSRAVWRSRTSCAARWRRTSSSSATSPSSTSRPGPPPGSRHCCAGSTPPAASSRPITSSRCSRRAG